MSYNCENRFCFHNYKGRFYCSCRICDRQGSAAFLNECRKNQEFKDHQKQKQQEESDSAWRG